MPGVPDLLRGHGGQARRGPRGDPGLRLQDDYWRVVEQRASYVGRAPEVVVQGWRDAPAPAGPWADAVRGALRGAASVLDVGAGDRAWQDVLRRLGVDAAYASLDVETRHAHEHRSLDEVSDGAYDGALVLEVLEHLDAQSGVDLLEGVARVLRPGGSAVVSTPNPGHPTSFQATDLTHVRPWPARDLHGVLHLVGFEDVVVRRLLHVEPRRRPLVPLQKAGARLIGVDPADHLLVTATRRP